ncbi:MAG: chemotaxis response regulator protein-glutamate methylesterase [Paucibacter sp.]|nr:chemotaxis response regulator protein-glutamate methylesterase [Roseateles sp.]
MKRVLIVDDSALMRRLMTEMLSEAGFEVAAARTGVEGVNRLTEWHPDVVTLDINMPEMDGLTALSLLMQARPTPVVMVSSLTEQGTQATLEALALGAVDFVHKPGGTISLSMDQVREELVGKVRAAAQAQPRRPSGLNRDRSQRPALSSSGGGNSPRPEFPARSPRVAAPAPARFFPAAQAQASGVATEELPGLVLIGVSTGGPRTLEDILPQLPENFPWAVLVAQHMPPHFTESFAQRMNGLCRLTVRECSAPTPLTPGMVLIAKGGCDMIVTEQLGRLVAQPRPESPAHPWHPSVDVLVESAMRRLPAQRLIGVLLTGMGDDGAASMTRLRQSGGRTVAESSDSAVVFGMPAELIRLGGASVVRPSSGIAQQIQHWISAS